MNQYSNKTAVLIATTIATFMLSFMSSSLNIALPQIGIELEMDAVSLVWAVIAYMMTSVVCVVPFGRIADLYGRKRVYVYGMWGFILTTFLLGVSTSGTMLIVLRFVQGAAGALLTSTSVAILSSAFPANERGRVLGINSTAVYLGFSLVPFIGGLLTQYLGWRSIFFLTTPIELIAIIITYFKIKGDWFGARGEKFDVAGSLIYSLALVAIVFGFTHLPELSGFGFIAIGIAGFIIFVFWERRTLSPIINVALFWGNRVFTLTSFAALLNYGATWGVGFLLSLYLQYIKGFSPQDAGFIMVTQPIIQAVFSSIAGRLSDRLPPRLLAAAGMALTVIGLVTFVFLDKETTLAYVIAGLVLIGLGVAFFVVPNTNATITSVEKKHYGIASAAVTTMRQLGMIVSMGLIMLVFNLFIGNVQITKEYYGAFLESVHTIFMIFAGLCCIGVFASLSKGKTSE